MNYILILLVFLCLAIQCQCRRSRFNNFYLAQKSYQNYTEDGCVEFQNTEKGNYSDCSKECFSKYDYEQQCQLANEGCVIQHKFGRFNFFEVQYCSLEGNFYIFVPLSLLIMFLIFRFITAVVEDYLIIAITYIAQYFKLSDQIAGITLIAMANGAGDVITAIVASDSEGGVYYNIGSLYGAGLFACSFVIALTIIDNKSGTLISITNNIIYRDIGFYILATIITILFSLGSYIYWWSAVIFFVVYFSMVALVFYQDRRPNKINLKTSEEILFEKEIEREIEKEKDKEQIQQINRKVKISISSSILIIAQTDDKKEKEDHIKKFLEQSYNSKSAKKIVKNIINKSKLLHKRHADFLSYQDQEFNRRSLNGSKSISKIKIQQNDMKQQSRLDSVIIQEEEETNFHEDHRLQWEDKTLLSKIDFILDLPFEQLRRVTIPPCESEQYDQTLCIIWPFPGLIFILWVFDILYYWESILFGGILALTMFGIFHQTQKDLKKGQTPSYFIWICGLSSIMSILWCYALTEILIDLLDLYIIVFKLNNTYIGLTILGIGTSMPDAITTIALAKQGLAQMAIIGTYSGQVFGLLIGFGLAQLRNTVLYGPQEFNLFKDPSGSVLEITVLFVQLLNLIGTSIFALSNNLKMTISVAVFMLVVYITFLISVTGIQIWYLIDNK